MKYAPIIIVGAMLASTAVAQRSTSTGPTGNTYGTNKVTEDEIEDDPADRRVLKRLNTRVNGRLETRIERRRSISAVAADLRNPPAKPYARPRRNDVLPGDLPSDDALPGD